jgi:hypothetical protein
MALFVIGGSFTFGDVIIRVVVNDLINLALSRYGMGIDCCSADPHPSDYLFSMIFYFIF